MAKFHLENLVYQLRELAAADPNGRPRPLRVRLADWLSGGEITRLERQRDLITDRLFRANEGKLAMMERAFKRGSALDAIIAAGQTSNPNATVKRMVAIARKARG